MKQDRLIVLLIYAMLLLGPWLVWKRYAECRQHFSVFYCLTSK